MLDYEYLNPSCPNFIAKPIRAPSPISKTCVGLSSDISVKRRPYVSGLSVVVNKNSLTFGGGIGYSDINKIFWV